MSHYLFTSESVAEGHPDKVADQISDAVLDACLAKDPHSKVACETLITSDLVVLAGEITTHAKVPYDEIVRQTLSNIGYLNQKIGFDPNTCRILTPLHEQSPEITHVVDQNGAGDQGTMFGFACDDTPELMPMPISCAHRIMRAICDSRHRKTLSYLRPDGKTQVTVEYSSDHVPQRIHTIVLSTQHDEEVSQNTLQHDMKELVTSVIPKGLIDKNTLFFINPTGRFVIGGPQGDTGMTGRKIIVDTYGGMGRHGGGAFSGKDPTKVDRSGAYAMRYVAKNIVAAGLARRCEVQVSYAIGMALPISIRIDTFGTGKVKEELIASAIPKVFDLTPRGILNMLNLCRPIFYSTAFGGHFGYEGDRFTWEKTDRVKMLIETLKK